jgi:hypothetical protein
MSCSQRLTAYPPLIAQACPLPFYAAGWLVVVPLFIGFVVSRLVAEPLWAFAEGVNPQVGALGWWPGHPTLSVGGALGCAFCAALVVSDSQCTLCPHTWHQLGMFCVSQPTPPATTGISLLLLFPFEA